MSLSGEYTGSGGGLNVAHRGLESGRIGPDNTRTFHCDFASVKCGESGQAALDYALRAGDYAEQAEELEHAAGDRQAVERAAELIEASARITRGRTAERHLVKQVFELPAASSKEQRERLAEAVVADWRGRGHEAVAVVHVHGADAPQPHMHVLVAARPVRDEKVDRSVRILADKAAVKRERAGIADLINEHCDPAVRFHPGRLADTGIFREPKKRIPEGTFRRARGEMRADPGRGGEIEASMHRESATARAPLHAERYARWQARKPEIDALKASGEWPPKSRRRWLEDRIEKGEAKTSDAERRAEAAETQVRELSEKQTTLVTDVHREAGRDRPDLTTGEGQSAAWEFVREVIEHGAAIAKAKAEEADRERAAAEAERAKALAAEQEKAQREENARRALDARRTSWTRERQAREKYAERRRNLLAASGTSKDQMVRGFKQDYDMEAGMIRMVDGKGRNATGEERQWRAEAVAVHDMLYEAAGKHGVNFGHGLAAPAWRIDLDLFLDHACTVGQDENGDRTHVAFPRVAGAPELVHDREQRRWDYRHPDAEQSYWMKAENAPDWESAARIAHYASVRDALKRGEKVPEKVTADYPDLTEKAAPVKEQPVSRPKPSPSRGGSGR